MKLFGMKAILNGSHKMADYLEHNYVCAGRAGIGDLETANESEIRSRLLHFNYNDEHEFNSQLNTMIHFVLEMEDGDHVFVVDGEDVHLGDLGDYYYLEQFDTPEDGSCHRRGVTWLSCLRKESLDEELQALLNQPEEVTMLSPTLSRAQIDDWLTGRKESQSSQTEPLTINPELVQEAIHILAAAMKSENAERRERAAAAILAYASRSGLPIPSKDEKPTV